MMKSASSIVCISKKVYQTVIRFYSSTAVPLHEVGATDVFHPKAAESWLEELL